MAVWSQSGRGPGHKKNFTAVWKRDNGICRYCDFPGDAIDHIIPWSFKRNNSMENLVVACARCNTLASNLFFADFNAKRDYLLKIRRKEILKDVRRVLGWSGDDDDEHWV